MNHMFRRFKPSNYTTSKRMDVHTVFFCANHNMCLLKVDLDGEGKCGMCHLPVTDITDSPLAQSWRAMVYPKPTDIHQ